MKYFANFNVNNGTMLQKDIEGTNKKELAKRIAKSAKANVYVGNEFSWNVWDEDDIIVMAGAGRKTENGFSYYNTEDLIGEQI